MRLFSLLIASADSCSFFFLFSFFFLRFSIYSNLMWFIKFRPLAGMCGVCVSVCGCVRGYACVHECVQVCDGVCRCVWECAGVHGCMWDEFSEYLLETWVLTSEDFNTYPIRIFYVLFKKIVWMSSELWASNKPCSPATMWGLSIVSGSQLQVAKLAQMCPAHTQDLRLNRRIQKLKKILLANNVPNSLNINENYGLGV